MTLRRRSAATRLVEQINKLSRPTLAVLVAGLIPVVTIGVAPAAAASSPDHLAAEVATLAASPSWLQRINAYRVGAGLPEVTERPEWSSDIEQHLRYLDMTPPSLRTGQYANAHTENPASAFYTDGGARAGASSNLAFGFSEQSADASIDTWLRAPFHAIGILRPDLREVAFAKGANGAGLNVISGLGPAGPQGRRPVFFPGDGMSTNLTTFTGESPDPVETCWPDRRNTGLPLVAMLTQAPSGPISAELRSKSGRTMSSQAGDLCVVDQDTYHSSDQVYGPTGLSLLKGERAVFLIPQSPLTDDHYEATISQAGQARLTWSFAVNTAEGPSALARPVREVRRVAGADRVATAIAVSTDGFPAPRSAGAAVLATSGNFADALTGSPLAHAKNAPMLLTGPGALDPQTSAELQRLLPPGAPVYMLGGDTALSPAVETSVKDLGFTVARLSGGNRYETAVAIASELGNPTTVIEATGENFADGLAAGPAAAKTGAVVLLTSGDVISPATRDYLARYAGIRHAVGRPACTADPGATCLAGASRYDTSVVVAREFFTDPAALGFASGQDFPDALAGSVHSAAASAPVILVPPAGPIPSATVEYLFEATATTGYAYGGRSALDDAVLARLAR